MKSDARHALSHTAIYLLARGLPGLIAFLSIPLFSRLLDPTEYGRYALVVATVNLLNALLFQWLRLSLVRYLPAYDADPGRLKATLLRTTWILLLALGALGAIACLLPAARPWRAAALAVWVVLAAQALFDLCCELARASIRPWRYMRMQIVRSAVSIALGAVLVLAGAKAWGPIGGFLVGMLLAVATVFRGDWTSLPRGLDRDILAKVCQYGLPLSMTVALAVVISSSDRFLIAWLLGADAAGQYSAAVDFTSQTLTLLLVVVHMAIFPLAVQAWERSGSAAARERMRGNALLLLALGVPCVVGMIILAPGITALVLGSKFRAAATGIIPLIAVGTFLAGLKAYHFDAAFQFAHRTLSQVWIVLAAAIVNVALNLALIPALGINGAALASLLAYVVSIALTVIVGRRHFVVPMPVRASLSVLVAATAMAALLLPLRYHTGAAAVAVQIIGGASLYGALLVAMNFLDVRDHLARWWQRTRAAATTDRSHPVGVAPSLAQRD